MDREKLNLHAFAKLMKKIDDGWKGVSIEEIVWEIKNNDLYERELKIWNAGRMIPQKLQNEIAKWSDKQFGSIRQPSGVIYHLLKEIKELLEQPYDLKEYADLRFFTLIYFVVPVFLHRLHFRRERSRLYLPIRLILPQFLHFISYLCILIIAMILNI